MTTAGLGDLTFRAAGEGDVAALRVLVNEAYRELAEMGLNYTGAYQDEALTRDRMRGKEVYLAYLGERLVGTVSLAVEAAPDEGEPHLYLSQLAVAPGCKRRGIGRALLDLADKRAREHGLFRLRLDTAVPAEHLVRLYRTAGYEVIGEAHWEGKTYRSYIMEKRL